MNGVARGELCGAWAAGGSVLGALAICPFVVGGVHPAVWVALGPLGFARVGMVEVGGVDLAVGVLVVVVNVVVVGVVGWVGVWVGGAIAELIVVAVWDVGVAVGIRDDWAWWEWVPCAVTPIIACWNES